MKAIKLFSGIMALTMLMGSCTADEPTVNIVSTDAPTLRVTLAGSAANAVSRATIEADDTEKTVVSLLAVLYNNDGFYKTIEGEAKDDAYTFIVEDDASYTAYFVANANTDLCGALMAIPTGSKVYDDTYGLQAIVAAQAPDVQGEFLMVSRYPEYVTTHITETLNINNVRMQRLAARFDIINAADGIEVTKVTVNNRAVKTNLRVANEMPDADGWFEKTKDYHTENFVGSKDNPTTFEKKIYTYENYSVAGSTTLTSLTIEYKEGGEVKTHTIDLFDPASAALKPLAVKRNHLYRIRLSKAYKLNFELTIDDWTETDNMEHPDLNLEKDFILSEDEQEALNQNLLVYNLLTPYNVKSFTPQGDDVVATFFDSNIINPDDLTPENYYSFEDMVDMGVISVKDKPATKTIKDGEGNTYRLPTAGELTLILPTSSNYRNYDNSATKYDEQGRKILFHPLFNSYAAASIQAITEFDEKVLLKNTVTGAIDKTQSVESRSEYGFQGTSQLCIGVKTEDGIFNSSLSSLAPCYGLRFKGTDQYAAYKWEIKTIDNNYEHRYCSVKIKALPKDSEICIEDITDNDNYWSSGYIEYKFPAIGFYSYLRATPGWAGLGYAVYIGSSSRWDTNASYCLNFYEGSACTTIVEQSGNATSWRLIKVDE